jgi:hypothetical protein
MLVLGSSLMPASGSEATVWDEVENAKGARDEGRRHSQHP